MKPIRICPICGSRKVERVRRAVDVHLPKGSVRVPGVQFDHCQSCGEKFFDHAASQKIDAAVASSRPRTVRRKSA